jgi:hypothetical protein
LILSGKSGDRRDWFERDGITQALQAMDQTALDMFAFMFVDILPPLTHGKVRVVASCVSFLRV